jgi:hypothetical protein
LLAFIKSTTSGLPTITLLHSQFWLIGHRNGPLIELTPMTVRSCCRLRGLARAYRQTRPELSGTASSAPLILARNAVMVPVHASVRAVVEKVGGFGARRHLRAPRAAPGRRSKARAQRAAQHIHSLYPAVAISAKFVAEPLAHRRLVAVPWHGVDVDKEFLAAMAGGDEAETSIVMPGSEGSGQAHAGEFGIVKKGRGRLRELFGPSVFVRCNSELDSSLLQICRLTARLYAEFTSAAAQFVNALLPHALFTAGEPSVHQGDFRGTFSSFHQDRCALDHSHFFDRLRHSAVGLGSRRSWAR